MHRFAIFYCISACRWMTFADSCGHWLGLCDGSRGDPASLHGALWVPRYNGFETFFALFLGSLLDYFGIGLGIVQGIVELLSLSMEPCRLPATTDVKYFLDRFLDICWIV